jgi:hypothetical protein
MRDTTVVTPAATADTTAAFSPADAITEPVGRLRRPLILATGLSVAAAVLATALARVLSHRRRDERQDVRRTSPRGAPISTINVNWGLALFGANVVGEQRRRGGRLRGGLLRRRH